MFHSLGVDKEASSWVAHRWAAAGAYSDSVCSLWDARQQPSGRYSCYDGAGLLPTFALHRHTLSLETVMSRYLLRTGGDQIHQHLTALLSPQ